MRIRGASIAIAAALAGMLLAAPAAEATFHEMVIREVYAGTSDDSYVELQMYSSGQNFVSGHAVTLYNSSGTETGTFSFSSNVANGANQQTILIGDTGVQSSFGVAPDLSSASFSISASGGAACWAGTIDCVAWGNFSGSTPSSSAVGTPADPSGIPSGKALRRSIAPGCSTLLEVGDDTNNSATDFADADPNPRNNASTITETTCAAPPPPPSAVIDTKPPSATMSTSASFTYHSSPSGATFECRLDAAGFASCPSTGISYPGPLSEGNHTFQVRATNANGTGSPASYTWKVDLTAPTATITSHPDDPSPGASASFTYQANETGSTFQCSLAAGAASDSFSSCPSSGKTYTGLADGEYTFKVRATDQAGNQGAAASYTWTVDNSLADTTPPETTIDAKPPDPSNSSTASFTYHSNEPGSTFECKLDANPFAPCDAGGVTYTGLGDGVHTFQVRAIDSSGNVDQSPAGYTFTVSLPQPAPPPPPPPPPPISTPPAIQPSPPQTRLTGKPHAKTRDRTPTFRFRSSVAGVRYQCKVDHGRYRTCRSPYTTKKLSFGRHVVLIRAIYRGVADPTPARASFRIVRGKKHSRRAHHRKSHRRTHR